MLCLERGINERTVIVVPPSDKETVITATYIKHKACHGFPRATTGYDAPPDVIIDRQEVHLSKLRDRENAAKAALQAGKVQATP